MRLDVPLYRQPQDSYECGPTCLNMILAFHGLPVDETIADAFTYYSEGISVPQLGKYMMTRGFAAEIVTLNPHLFPLSARGVTDPAVILDYLNQTRDRAKTEERRGVADHLIDFLHAGGTYRLKIPDLTDAREELAAHRPLIALLTTRCLHGKPGFNFHFNVITGYDHDGLHVNDPLPDDDMGGKRIVPPDDFFYALYASASTDLDNASLLLLRPPG